MFELYVWISFLQVCSHVLFKQQKSDKVWTKAQQIHLMKRHVLFPAL